MSPRLGRAFTLVEVTIALGIFSFALIAMLGVMPVALSTARNSLDLTTATQVANTLASEMRQQPFSTLQNTATNYFDDAGGRLTGDSGAAIYKAMATVGSVVLKEGNPAISPNLKRVTIEVRSVASPTACQKFSYMVFNRGE